MKFQLSHTTRYDYAGDVSLSLQTLRLLPRERALRENLQVEPGGHLRPVTDVFENRLLVYEYIGQLRGWSICNDLEIEVQPRNPFDFLLDACALTLPFDYPASERAVLKTAMGMDSLPEGVQSLWPHTVHTVDFLVELNANIHRQFKYIERHEPGVQSVAETFQCGSGCCRDFAVLLLALVRAQGLAARLVSGYLLVPSAEDGAESGQSMLQGASAMHAWVEIYLPGAGWRGFDPTNGILADHLYIPCAVGLEPAQVTPVSGQYYSNHPLASEFTVALEIRALEL